MLIDTNHGLIPASRVVRAHFSYKPDVPSRIVYDGSGAEMSAVCTLTESQLADMLAPIIPANPGYHVLFMCDDEPHEVLKYPVLAWRISDSAQPVTTELIDTNDMPVLTPDGVVILPDDQQFGSIGEWRQHAIAELQRKAAA